ncbi:undecaprenyldiphospho-muramoylpentapeptide beta-N-acetylglucosaminyltransferase [Janibacter cremeus]|uniref:UDP-N-acetylglucosamine--N-acetylmuramyl-(pentapeptide) pyrophosphoryl-undecaprenol N-acetylglucosamine transferase n=1 Tax=Janibacter cremeus TaxID=1285192 RepID=A0A852VLR2_9MICO|nr:undecaprenyldiphospho-muramoylpentapeptide beta-N-acetylglucosaminyltransferase [Janibacter cremeus]NYF97026.1 UDP-N-acetylglucosamine--N-acetylmuramyl-(pentapeptide) pyrophosphoryl-undecaprenol N-acetylglucosamine transferase [Janibacter cremeus]
MTGSRPTRILLAGGGTAGHVSPLLALADCLRRRDPAVDVVALGTVEGLESRLVPERGYQFRTVPKVPLPRRPTGDLVRLPVNLRRAVAAAQQAIEEMDAQVVVGFGGYVSTPAYLAARRLGVPIVIHEQNARAGIANKVGARFTDHVAMTFPRTKLPGGRVIGMPLRPEIIALDRYRARAGARTHFGLREDLPVLLVTGGSLGAKRLNDAFAASVATLRDAGVQVLHATGAGKDFEAVGGEPSVPYVVLPYVDRMDLAYAAADAVVCRAGANTVCELTAVGLPGVYVPLPIGNGEQRLNAADVVEAGGGLLVEDADVDPGWVATEMVPMLRDAQRLDAMAEAAASVGHRHADETLADLVTTAWVEGGSRG